MTRKLAAIIAADVVGYSRLMGGDEAGTLAALKTHRRELIDPKIAEHQGRIVKTTDDIFGDGVNVAARKHRRAWRHLHLVFGPRSGPGQARTPVHRSG
jgi:hypothetical protein